MVTISSIKPATETTPALLVVTVVPSQLPLSLIDPLPVVTTSANITDETTGSLQLWTIQDPLSMVTTSTSHSALP